MKLTLRKANAIQLLINEKLNNTTINAHVTIDKYTPIQATVKQARETFALGLIQKLSLLATLYRIRQLVSKASQEAGISDLLAQMAFANKQEAMYKNFDTGLNVALYPGDEIATKQQDDLKTQVPTAYSRKDNFQVSIMEKTVLEGIVTTLSNVRKQKVMLSDKLLELNIKTEIELEESESDVLKGYDII